MPGVPTSRACDACRRRRKRCDEAQPSCSRCQKRQIPCVGGGRQRFVFKTYGMDHMKKLGSSESSISQSPRSSPDMAVSMSLINKLQNRQSRFEINWAHGSFMDEIPRRTNHSVALAAATEAFMLALPCTEVSHTLSQRRLRSYTAALGATRLALLHPQEAYTLNTLCAVYLLWICQSWTAVDDGTSVHRNGMASLLNQDLRFDPTDQFDRGVVYVACTVVIQQKMLLGKVDIEQQSRCWNFFNKVNAQTATVKFIEPAGESLVLVQKLSRMLLALFAFFRSRQTLPDVWLMYNTAADVVEGLSREVHAMRDAASHERIIDLQGDNDAQLELVPVNRHGLSAFKFALTLTLIMNATLSIHYPHSMGLRDFRRRYTDEALPIVMKAGQLAPMGVGFIGVFLSHVWAIEHETTQQSEPWDIYSTESATKRSITFSKKLESSLESLL